MWKQFNFHFYGCLAALFLLSGRWSVLRIMPEGSTPSIFYELRLYVVTLMVFSLLMIRKQIAIHQSRVKEFNSRSFVCLMLFVLMIYLITSAIWMSEYDLSGAKAWEVFLCLIGLASVYVFQESEDDSALISSFWTWMIIVLLLMALLGVASIGRGQRLAVLGGGANVYGRNMGLLALGCLYFIRKTTGVWNIIWYVVMALAIGLVLLSGSRGALASTLVGAGVYMAFDQRHAIRNIIAVVGVSMIFAGAVAFTEVGQQAYVAFEKRVLVLTLEKGHTSGRDTIYLKAIDLGLESPIIGVGLNGFPIRTGHSYPHNIFLEIFCETGAIGLFVFVLVILSFVNHVLVFYTSLDPPTCGCVAMLFVSAQFSGDLFDSRTLFLFIVLAVSPQCMRTIVPQRQSVENGMHGGNRVSLAGPLPRCKF